MATIDELQSWIWSYRNTVNDCNAKIARLKSVYTTLGDLKDSFRGIRNNTEDIFKEKGTWQGETHTSFCSGGAELDGNLGNYYRELDTAQDTVNNKIAELEAKKWKLLPIIDDLVAQVQNMKAAIQNALN